jgi:dipeptidyl aminopeptidase/acylaminoacyl peptidase
VDRGVPLTEIARFNAGAKGAKNPAWAADGSEVFFVSAGKGLRELDAMTGDISEVSNNPSDEYPEPGRTEGAFAYLNKGKIVFRVGQNKEKSESAGAGWTVSEIEWRPDSDVLRYIARGSEGYKIGTFDPRSGSHETLYSIKSGTLLALRYPSRAYEFFALLETESGGKKTSSVLVLSEGNTTSVLFQLPGTITAMQASPDGGLIYYIMNKIIYCFNRSNGLHQALAEKAGDLLEISPCGKWLMTNPAGLAVCPSSGGRLRQLVSAPGIVEFAWSIRGQIAVISHMNGHSEIWLFRVDEEVVG